MRAESLKRDFDHRLEELLLKSLHDKTSGNSKATVTNGTLKISNVEVKQGDIQEIDVNELAKKSKMGILAWSRTQGPAQKAFRDIAKGEVKKVSDELLQKEKIFTQGFGNAQDESEHRLPFVEGSSAEEAFNSLLAFILKAGKDKKSD